MKSTTSRMPWRLVVAGCIGFFAATATGSTRAPFLPDMAADLEVSLPAIANLFGVTATAWGISSWAAGYASDRVGRGIFLIGAPACLSLVMLAVSQVQSYTGLLILIVLGGLFCGAFTASTLAEVSLRTHRSLHGRALGYVMSGQSLTLLLGIPVAALLGSVVGWRGMHVALAVLAFFAVGCIVFGTRVPVGESGDEASSSDAPRTTLRQAMTGPIARLFVALVAERVSFGLATFYYASYLRTAYNLPIKAVALPLAGFALGNIVGTFVGGQVADRFPYRRISFAVSLSLAGLVAIPWFLFPIGVSVTVTLGVVFAFFDAMSRPPLLAAMADVPPEVRGTVMGMTSSIASIGWLTAAVVGGWLYAGAGFAGFSPLMALMCLCGALIVVPDSRLRHNLAG